MTAIQTMAGMSTAGVAAPAAEDTFLQTEIDVLRMAVDCVFDTQL